MGRGLRGGGGGVMQQGDVGGRAGQHFFAYRLKHFDGVRHAAEWCAAFFTHLGDFLQQQDVAWQTLNRLDEE